MSFGSSSAGMPSFVSAISNAYRPGTTNRDKCEEGVASIILPHKFCVKVFCVSYEK